MEGDIHMEGDAYMASVRTANPSPSPRMDGHGPGFVGLVYEIQGILGNNPYGPMVAKELQYCPGTDLWAMPGNELKALHQRVVECYMRAQESHELADFGHKIVALLENMGRQKTTKKRGANQGNIDAVDDLIGGLLYYYNKKDMPRIRSIFGQIEGLMNGSANEVPQKRKRVAFS